MTQDTVSIALKIELTEEQYAALNNLRKLFGVATLNETILLASDIAKSHWKPEESNQ